MEAAGGSPLAELRAAGRRHVEHRPTLPPHIRLSSKNKNSVVKRGAKLHGRSRSEGVHR